MPSSQHAALPRTLIPLLASLVALGPMSVDLYLPAIPTLVEVFDTSLSQVQLTLSAYLAGFALFHLVCGPLADSYGRRPIILGGLVLFTVSSIGCALATTISDLVTWRFLQGVGTCVGPTLGRAIARDLFDGREAARVLAIIATLMGVAPALAPFLGSFILTAISWEALFVTLAGIGMITLAWCTTTLPESVPEPQAFRLAVIARNYRELAGHGLYWRIVFASASLYAGMLGFVGSASYILIEIKGVSVQMFGFYFCWTALGYIGGSFLTSRLSGRLSMRVLMRMGAALGMATALLMLVMEYYVGSAWTLVIPMAVFAAAVGLVLPNATVCALRPFGHIAATAAAMFGFVQMAMGALATAVIGATLTASAYPMIVALLTLAALSTGLILGFSPQDIEDGA